jgi:Stealth protein CR2, conserved region 2/Stealth protein CR1, conserved region 1/Stealth protein CR4, conserved region 4
VSSSYFNARPDIVYLWVNGQDSDWQRRRKMAEKKYLKSDSCRFSNVDGRFRDNDELRYSLRSLSPHLDSFGRIFIVTDRQRPDWLADHDRISVIDHRMLRDKGMPSTYSSKAIEACFDRLPGTNDAVYLNDDVFLGGSFSMEHLFNTRLQKTVIHFEQLHDRDPLEDVSQNSAMQVSHQILADSFDQTLFFDKPMAHAPRYLLRKHVASLFKQYPDAIQEARAEIFRESSIPSVIADLYGRWLLASDKAMESPVPHALLSSGSPHINEHLMVLLENFNQLSYFCINDTLDNTSSCHGNFSLIQSVLDALFPMPSEFELPLHAIKNTPYAINTGMS